MQRIIKAQAGPQTELLRNPAEVIIYGGAAGGGKTFGLLMSVLRHKNVQGFGATIFRKYFKQVFNQGGLWDESVEMFLDIEGARPRYSRGEWWFYDRDGRLTSTLHFDHIEKDIDLGKFQGAQICEIGFDELTHFTQKQFFYMLSRNRSMCGIKPHVIATCNPDADSWVANFVSWWINQDTGYPIPERSGKLRYFIRRNEEIHWASTRKELYDKFQLETEEEKGEVKSATFIMSSIYDNQMLLKANPGYLANLKAMSVVDRERLLHGNWKIKAAAGLYFNRSQVTMLESVPADVVSICRAWDLAATGDKENAGDPDFTAGVLVGKRKNGSFVVLDVINQRIKAGDVERLIYNTAVSDRAKWGIKCKIRVPQDPGAAGKIVANSYIKKLAGFPVTAIPVSGSKELRATPFSAQWQNGNVEILIAPWNDMYFVQLESFPESKHDDMVDASSDAFNEVAEPTFNLKNLV